MDQVQTSTPQVELLNRLLRSELSAVETYRIFLDRCRTAPSPYVRRLGEEHSECARMLTAQISELDGVPSEGVGPWLNLGAIIEATADPAQDLFALRALKEGEAQDILNYENALEAENLPDEARKLIGELLLPRARGRLPVLDDLLAAA